MKRVYGFNEGGKELIDILGGKGGNNYSFRYR